MNHLIYFVGKLPPPIGGVTVFNQRKIAQFKARQIDVVVIEPILKNWLKFIKLFFDKKRTLYLSASNYLMILIILIFGSCCRVVFYDHNSSRHLTSYNDFKKMIYYYFFKKVSKIVLVSPQLKVNYEIYDFYSSITFEVESAFLPPAEGEMDGVIKTYPEVLQKIFLSDDRVLVIASAFKPNLSEDGKDIYSLRETITAFSALSLKYPHLIFLISIAQFPDEEFSREIKDKIEILLAIRKNVVLLDNGRTLWPLFKRSLLYIRPTTTDGDAISLREALYFKSKVLASDVVHRPAGTFLFNLDNDSLVDVIQNQLESIELK